MYKLCQSLKLYQGRNPPITNLFIFTSTSTYLSFSTVLPSSFPHLLVRIAPFFVRSLFIFYSSFLYLPVRLAPSFVRSLFVLCSSFVRLYVAVVPPLEGVRGRFSSSFVYPLVWLTPHTVIDLALLVFLAFLILISIIGIFGIMVLIRY